jgi:hypothetical protein
VNAKSNRFRRRQGRIVEPLENRRLLCGLSHASLPKAPTFDWATEQANVRENGPEAVSIVWSNRANTTAGGAGDTDGFGANFGTAAPAGRAVVDAVFAYWARIITNWNRSDGTTTLQVNLSMDTGFGFGASGAPDSAAPSDGKPRTGSISMGRGNNDGVANNSNGWFFDPTPNDNSEFMGNIINAFAGQNSAGVGPDFFSVVSAELVHVLGLISDKNNNGAGWNGYRMATTPFVTATGIRDNAEGGGAFGFFYTFDGPTIDHLMTGYNSGDGNSNSWGNVVHTAGVGAPITFAGKTWVGSEDSGNAIYTNERTLPSYVSTYILADAYGYTVNNPATFGTFYATNNNGNLRIRGSEGVDVITISSSGGNLIVNVDPIVDVPGTGNLSNDGNLAGWVSSFPLSSVGTIIVEGNGGQDFIRIDSDGGKFMNIDAGGGDDFIDFAFSGGRNLDAITASKSLVGGSGNDSVFVYDDNNTVADTYTITSARFDRPFWGGFSYASDIEGLVLTTGTAANIVNITSTFTNQPIFLNSSGGQDVVNIGTAAAGMNNINANIQVQNNPSTSTVNLIDGADTTADNVFFDSNAGFGYALGAATGTVFWEHIDVSTVNYTATAGQDTINVVRLSDDLNIENAGGADAINVGRSDIGLTGINSLLTIDNAPSLSTVVIDDTGNSIARNATLDVDGNYYRLTGMGFGAIRWDEFDVSAVTIRAGSGSDTLNVLRSDDVLDITTAGGSDRVNLGNFSNGVQSILQTVTVSNPVSFTTLSVNNSGDTAVRTVTIDDDGTFGSMVGLAPATIFWKIADLEFLGGDGLIITSGGGPESFNFHSVSARTSLTNVIGAGDAVTVGSPVEGLSRVNRDLTLTNPPSFTTLSIDDSANLGPRLVDVTSNSGFTEFRANGLFGGTIRTRIADTVDPINYTGSQGDDTINVVGLDLVSVIFNTGDGDDRFVFGQGFFVNSVNGINAGTVLNAGTGTNSLEFHNELNNSGNGFIVSATDVQHSDMATVAYNNISDLRIYTSDTSAATQTHVVTETACPVTFYSGTSSDWIYARETSGGAVFVRDTDGLDAVFVNDDLAGSAFAEFPDAVTRLGSLVVYDGGYAFVGNDLGSPVGNTDVMVVNDLALGNSARLDLRTNSMIIDYAVFSPMPGVAAAVGQAYSGGLWNANGIASTWGDASQFAVGYAESADLFGAGGGTFAGQAVDDSAVLLTFTRYGDANLNRSVDFPDLLKLAQNYGSFLQTWSTGNFDYDVAGEVAFSDLLILAQNYNGSVVRDLRKTPLGRQTVDRLSRVFAAGGQSIGASPRRVSEMVL